MAQQTAVEWLQEQLNPDMKTMQGNIMQELLEQAKQMEKEQIMNARLSTFDLIRRDDVLKTEQYYNETYGK